MMIESFFFIFFLFVSRLMKLNDSNEWIHHITTTNHQDEKTYEMIGAWFFLKKKIFFLMIIFNHKLIIETKKWGKKIVKIFFLLLNLQFFNEILFSVKNHFLPNFLQSSIWFLIFDFCDFVNYSFIHFFYPIIISFLDDNCLSFKGVNLN